MDPVEQRFERVVQQILAHDRAIVHGLFSDQILSDLLLLMQEMRSAEVLRPAAIGSSERAMVHTEIRSDFIHWWPDAPDHPAMQAFLGVIDNLSTYMNRTCFTGINSREFMFAAYPPGARYARHLDDFQNKNARKFSVITYLNRDWNGDRNGNGVGPGTGTGTGWVGHRPTGTHGPERVAHAEIAEGGVGPRGEGPPITGTGGELRTPDRGRVERGNGDGGELVLYGASGVEIVAPTFGTTVIFPSSELEHEVLPARRERYSVTGWLR